MVHCDGGLGGLWRVGASGRDFSPWRGLMAHCDGGLWRVGAFGRNFSPWRGLIAHCDGGLGGYGGLGPLKGIFPPGGA